MSARPLRVGGFVAAGQSPAHPAEIAADLPAYATAGYAQVDCWVRPATVESLESFGRVLQELDG